MVFSDLYMNNKPSDHDSTIKLIRDVMEAEGQVDLAVLIGDTVDPDFEESYTARFSAAVDELIRLNVPWVSTGGEDRPGNAVDRDYMMSQD